MDAALQLIPAVTTLGHAAEKVGVVVAAGMAAAAVLAPAPRVRAAAMLGALVLTPVLLLASIWDSSQLHPLRAHPALSLPLAVIALAAVAGAAVLVDRRPQLLPVAAVAALPFRIPIASGGTTSNLLVPLYFVVAAGALAYAVPRLRGRGAKEEHAPGLLEKALLGLVVLYAIQASYSADFTHALQQVVFFYVPFALLFVLLGRVSWTPQLALRCLGALVVLAVVFVGIGFVEYHSRRLLLNPKVITSNELSPYFRVNSLFFDPNIYGRFLAIVMLLVAAVVIWSTTQRTVLVGAGVLAFLWGGLVLTFSQSSFGALLVGLAVLGGLRWNPRRALALSLAAVALGAGFVAVSPGTVRLHLGSSKSADTATSGRYDLIKGGVELFGDRPLQGYGAGSFPREFRRHQRSSTERAVSASHTIPVTVAAEQGIVGLVLYIVLLVLAFARLLFRASRSLLRAAVAAAFAALVFHTFLYAAFLEDPLTWTLLGVGVALARAVPATPARERART